MLYNDGIKAKIAEDQIEWYKLHVQTIKITQWLGNKEKIKDFNEFINSKKEVKPFSDKEKEELKKQAKETLEKLGKGGELIGF